MTEKTTFQYEGNEYWKRLITDEELADLPTDWLNPTVDIRKYYQVVCRCYEVCKEFFDLAKSEGYVCQIYNSRFYVEG